MKIVKMHAAKTHLSRLVKAIASGEEAEIVIAVGSRPAARLVPVRTRAVRPLGLDEGRISLASDFDAVDSKIAALFTGKR